jgi:hypothetical protein
MWIVCAYLEDKTDGELDRNVAFHHPQANIHVESHSTLCNFCFDSKQPAQTMMEWEGDIEKSFVIAKVRGESCHNVYLNDELSFNVGVENPNALLVIERIQREVLCIVSRMYLSGLRCESSLTAHTVSYKIIWWFIGEALGTPRIFCNWIYEFDWSPTSNWDWQPLLLKVSTETIQRMIIFRHHNQMIDIFNAIHSCQALTARISTFAAEDEIKRRRVMECENILIILNAYVVQLTDCLTFSVTSKPIQHVNGDSHALVCSRNKRMSTVETAFNVPK